MFKNPLLSDRGAKGCRSSSYASSFHFKKIPLRHHTNKSYVFFCLMQPPKGQIHCENPSLFPGSKLASWGIPCDKTLTDLLRRRVMGASMWQSTSLCGHFEAPSFRAVCLWKRVLRSVYWWKIWPVTNSPSLVWENWGMIPSCPMKIRAQVGTPAPSYLLVRPGRL